MQLSRKPAKPSALQLLFRFMSGNGMLFFLYIAIYFISFGIDLFPPIFQQIYTDNIINRKNPDWYNPLLVLYLGLFAIEMIAWISIALKRATLLAKMNILASSRYVWNVLRLPLQVINQFSVGELIARFTTITPTAINILKFFPAIVLGFESFLSAYLLMLYNIYLGLIIIVAVILTMIAIKFSASYQSRKAKAMEVTSAHLQNVTMTGLKNIEAIKSIGGECDFFQKWDLAYTRSLNARINSTTLTIWMNIIPVTIMQICNAVVLCLGTWFILQGELTPGMLLASQGLMNSIVYPTTFAFSNFQYVLKTYSALERIEEVNQAEELCKKIEIPDDDEIPQKSKLSGTIELKDITFGYDRSQPPILRHFSLTIKAGERVAFVGLSGCGKSTIANLISGLYEPWEGEVLFDGEPLKNINHLTFTNSVSVVNQDIILFEDTVANNVKMWDNSIEDFSMVLACHDAHIHKEIMSRPGAYQSYVSDNGKNFSGGQRQRLEIAAALAKEPTILILDEATSALDTQSENGVIQSVYDLGITTIMIAHRLNTVRRCDKIYVMEYGEIKQEGTHEELLGQEDGLYYKLNKFA